jgi:uncharacterized protein with HEPN domain
MKLDESIFLHHILDAITRTEGYLQGIEEAIFKQDTFIQDGVIRQIEIIGEAAKRLSEDLRLQSKLQSKKYSLSCLVKISI